MTSETFKAFTERLKDMRSVQTQPNKIKFIDDILSALQYKDRVIEANHRYIGMMSEACHRATQDYFDVKLKLEGLALRYSIPGWEIEKWLRMNPDQVVREVKFWQDWDKQTIECEHLINGTKPAPIYPVRIKYASKPIGLPAGYRIKTELSIKEIVNNFPL